MIVGFTAVVFLASAAIVAYLTDWVGLSIAPFGVLPASVLATAGTFMWLRRSVCPDRSETVAIAAIVVSMLGWLLWLARPSFLPPGSGPDLTHHLMLIDFIERQWRLPHDPQLGAVLGEMVSYTPGAHLLAALAGAWTRTDGLHTVYSIVAFTVALKAGLIFLIARRLMPVRAPRTLLALAAVVLLFGPRDYFIGSFAEASYLAQVVSELFAMAMWLGIIVWSEQPSVLASALMALFGAATFLAWPVALGPVLLLAAIVIAFRFDLAAVERIRHLAIATVPIGLIATLHALGRTNALVIVGVAGYVAYPEVGSFGWWFLVPACVGVMTSAFDRRGRTVSLFVVAIALQSASLLVVANRAGSARPYMALKMVYLAIYPMAVAGSLAFAGIGGWIGRIGGMGRIGETWKNLFPSSPFWPPCQSIAAGSIVLALAYQAVRSVITVPRPKPAVSQTLFLAGDWARTNLKPECVDYVVDNVYSAYWLHIAVLRNARAAPRSTDDDTYLPEKERIRWIVPDGLPYAIADDFDRLPKDIRTNVDIVARFGPAAIIKRRARATCGG